MVTRSLSLGPLGRLPSIETLRSWALFAVAALAPSIAVGGLGLRALRNEEAATLRETAVALDAAAERASLQIRKDIADSSARLAAVTLDADPATTEAAVRAVTPPFAEPIALGPDRSVLVPLAPPRAQQQPPARCTELASALASPARHEGARRQLLEQCGEARDATGRWLWPVVALDGLRSGEGDALAAWLDAHAGMLSAAEREATLLEARAAGALEGPARARVVRALEATASRREALLAELRDEDVAATLRKKPGPDGSIAWTASASVGQLHALPDGRLVGFVVYRRSLADALAAGWMKLSPDQRARLVTGAAMRAEGAAPAGARARSETLGATVVVAPELGLRIVPSDPGAALRHASRSRAILGGVAALATVIAFGVAAFLFARMRAAKRSSELRTDFVSIVSHELRTPIASIRMLSELLEQGRVEEGERQEVHEAIARESRRLGETVDRLLGFSRMAAGRYVVTREEASVADAVAQSIDTFEERHPDAPRVVRALDPEARARIDAGQLRLAVDNLLENAVKYAPDGGPYDVRVAREDGGVAVRVKDAGPGIARRDQRRIFEPFERADDRLSRATEGSGIGLSLVRHVARAHDGEARVESEPGRGAAFTIWLPTGKE